MGGRVPMAGQTAHSWPSAGTLQSTKNTIFPNQLRSSAGAELGSSPSPGLESAFPGWRDGCSLSHND